MLLLLYVVWRDGLFDFICSIVKKKNLIFIFDCNQDSFGSENFQSILVKTIRIFMNIRY